MVAGNTLLKFFFGQMLDQLREDGAARVHPSLFHSEDRRKEVNPALFQFKSFLLRPCVIMLIFNGLEWPPEILAGQQCSRNFASFCRASSIETNHSTFKYSSRNRPLKLWKDADPDIPMLKQAK